EPEVIGDILAWHRKLDFVASWGAVGHFQQEACHAFLCTLDQQQYVISRVLELAARKAPKLTCNIIVPPGERKRGFPLDHKKLRIGDRLGGECVLRAGLYTEDVARQIEGSDLAAAVAQGFEGAHRSADHFVERTSRTAFAVDLCIARKHHSRTHLLDRPGE